VNKSCHNCNKDISYYAGFCHHCETKQEYVQQLGKDTTIKRDIFGGERSTDEIIDKKSVIKRNISSNSVNEFWEEENEYFNQYWIGERKNHVLQFFNYEVKEDDFLYEKKWEWNRRGNESHFGTRIFNKYLEIPNSDIPELIDQDYTEFYSGVPPYNKKVHYIIKNSQCLSGNLYSPSGNVLYSIVDGNGIMLDEKELHPATRESYDKVIYYSKNGILKISREYFSSDKEEFELGMNLINKQKEQLEIRKRKEEYYSSLKELRENFHPEEYNKTCSECFETIKLPAKICLYCRREFSGDEVELAIDKKFREIYPEP